MQNICILCDTVLNYHPSQKNASLPVMRNDIVPKFQSKSRITQYHNRESHEIMNSLLKIYKIKIKFKSMLGTP